MAIDTLHSELYEPNAATQPELLVAATLHLMSHYTADGGCVKLASVIERHLKALAALPEITPVLRATCLQLSEQWKTVVERTMPKPDKHPRFSTLLLGARFA